MNNVKRRRATWLIAILLLFALLLGGAVGQAVTGTAVAQRVDASLNGIPTNEVQTQIPGLTLTLTPYNPPVVLPASGGLFQYTAEFKNDGARDLNVDAWMAITRPDGTEVLPADGPFRFRLPRGWSTYRDDLTQDLIASDPAGTYTLWAYLGRYPDRIMASASFTFEKLADGGWFPQSSGTTDWLFDVHFADANNGWAVGQTNEIVHTTNGGDTWSAQNTPIFTNLWSVFAVDAQNAWAGGDLGVIIHTEDGGANWVEQDASASGAYNWEGLYFLDANTGWVVGGKPFDFTASRRSILFTNDGGDTWESQYSVSNETPLNAVHFVDANNGWVVGDAGGIMHTSNGGVTWVKQTSGVGEELSDVHFIDANIGWIVGRAGTLLKTTNGGNTWTSQSLGTADNFTGLYFADANNGWISGTSSSSSSAVILHTNDGGATWHNQDPGTSIILYDIVFADANSGWAVGDNGTIIHTDTGGE